MRAAIRKSDGRIMESQSGNGPLDALIANAQLAGVDCEVSYMDDAEFSVLLQQQISDEVAQLPPRLTADDVVQLLKDKGVINDSDVEVAVSSKPISRRL